MRWSRCEISVSTHQGLSGSESPVAGSTGHTHVNNGKEKEGVGGPRSP